MDDNLKLFIAESNKIDLQYDEHGHRIPGAKPGDPLFDRHVNAINKAVELLRKPQLPLSFCLDVHRELTQGLWFFESQNGSGQYREYDVRIGSEIMPPHQVVKSYVEEKWIPAIKPFMQKLTREEFESPDAKVELIFNSHYCYECIHPFIDGNGRSGRCIFYAMCLVAGVEEPPVIFYRYREVNYYQKIQRYRRLFFENWLVSPYSKNFV